MEANEIRKIEKSRLAWAGRPAARPSLDRNNFSSRSDLNKLISSQASDSPIRPSLRFSEKWILYRFYEIEQALKNSIRLFYYSNISSELKVRSI